MATQKKVEQGVPYLTDGKRMAVRPLNGRAFALEELQQAVGGYVEAMVSVEARARVYVNAEGALKNLTPNPRTWEFANRQVYLLNGYGSSWRVAGNAILVRKVAVDDAIPALHNALTVAQAIGGAR